MKRAAYLILPCLMILSACGPQGTEIEVGDPWVRSGIKDGNSAAYLSLQNPTSQDDALIGVSSDAAVEVGMHLSQAGADGVMRMIPQESIDLPAGGEVELKPGSYHLMLFSLKRDLLAGDQITMTLRFRNHEDKILTIPVKDPAEMGGSGMEGHMP